MSDVSTIRLYLMRATYLFMVVGLGLVIWPGILNHSPDWTVMRGSAYAMLGAASLLALLGLLHPLRMLPVLLFELVWKVIWLLAFALPAWSGGRVDADLRESVYACLLGIVILPVVIPWPYVVTHYLKRPGDRRR